MANGKWGHCRTCKHFASPASVPLPSEEAKCKHPELSRYALTVFGASGCNGWDLRPGVTEEAEAQPPPG